MRTASVEVQLLRPDHTLRRLVSRLYFTARDYPFDENGHAETTVELPEVRGEVLSIDPPSDVFWDADAHALRFEATRTYPEQVPPYSFAATLRLADRTVGVYVTRASR